MQGQWVLTPIKTCSWWEAQGLLLLFHANPPFSHCKNAFRHTYHAVSTKNVTFTPLCWQHGAVNTIITKDTIPDNHDGWSKCTVLVTKSTIEGSKTILWFIIYTIASRNILRQNRNAAFYAKKTYWCVWWRNVLFSLQRFWGQSDQSAVMQM